MSLSNTESEDFKPIDIHSLDSFEDEVSNRTAETEPDFDRFKILFDPADQESDEPLIFDSLHMSLEEKKRDPFQPLIREPEKKKKAAAKPEENKENKKAAAEPAKKKAAAVEPAAQIPEEPVEAEVEDAAARQASIEEQAFEQGYAKGLEQGLEKGTARGYEEGFAKGEAEGFAKGEQDGFATGKAEGYAKGEDEGRETGEQVAREEGLERLEILDQALKSVETVLDDMVDAQEPELLELVFTIVGKVIHASLDADDEIVRHTILDALKALARPREIDLNVSPGDYEYIEMIKDSFFEEIETLEHVSIKSDPMVKRGGCRIDTLTASVATDPEAKLKLVYDAVVNATGK